MLEKIIKFLVFILISILLIILIFLVFNHYKEKSHQQIEKRSINYILKQDRDEPNKKNLNEDQNQKQEIIDYDIILEIPKINLKKGILDRDNKDNNIDKNVTILKNSSYPDKDGNIYIAAHSGNGHKSYFNDLVKLEENDQANLYYEGNKYSYVVNEIKEINKNENVSIVTTTNNNLILITCSQKNKEKYLIVILQRRQN